MSNPQADTDEVIRCAARRAAVHRQAARPDAPRRSRRAAGARDLRDHRRNRSTGGEKGTSVMFVLCPPDYKPVVCTVGGDPLPAQQTAEVIDLSAPASAWTALPDLNVARPAQFTATLLPDGAELEPPAFNWPLGARHTTSACIASDRCVDLGHVGSGRALVASSAGHAH